MLRIQIEGRKRLLSFYLPQTYDEVGAEALVLLAPYLLKDTVSNRHAIIRAYLPKEIAPIFYKISNETKLQVFQCLDFLYQSSFDKPYTPFFKDSNGKKLYLPTQGLGNSTVQEYAFADKYMEAVRNGDSSQIDYLVACICRPQRKNYNPEAADYKGDIREDFNENVLSMRVADLKKVSVNLKLYVLLFFMGCKQSLAKKFPPIFKAAETESKTSSRPDFGLIGVIWDLAGNIANQEKVANMNLHDVMLYLCKQHYDNLELQKQHDKAKLLQATV